MMKETMKTLNDFDFQNKKVLVRCDFNIPLSEDGKILDDFRIKQTIPTIDYLLKNKAKIILMSHLGDPGGQVVENLRLNPIKERLQEYLNQEVKKADDCIGSEIKDLINLMEEGEILLLENLRFHKEEEENDDNFSKSLAELAEIYINDAFAVCHRKHASVVGVTKFLPSGAGILLEKEIRILKNLMEKPEKPLVVIIGGKKVETKVKFIEKISEIADFVLISSLIEKEMREKNIVSKFPEKIVKPIGEGNEKDLNDQTISLFKEKISIAKTVFWNGPVGKIEEEEFAKGSREIAKNIIESQSFSIVGGGETVEFVKKIGLIDKFGYVSTGGGAMLAFLGGEKLAGIEALK